MVLSACPAPNPLQAPSQRALQDLSVDPRDAGQDQITPAVLSPVVYQASSFHRPLDFEKQQV